MWNVFIDLDLCSKYNLNGTKKQEKLQEQISKEIEEQLARDRVEISFKPSDYMKKNRRKKKKIDIKNLEVENE